MSAFYTDFCAQCDRMVRRTPMGWYRCDCCGFESLRIDQSPNGAGVIPDTGSVGPHFAKRNAGLVSLTHKVENK